ncbi:MAG: replicative DNA helicase [Clostridiales bacterium]|nr:replicative DNA helicase [Clostridiales bacterium]
MSETVAAVRPLPHSLDAERSVLGAILQDGAAMMAAAESLTAEDFFTPAHQTIFTAALSLSRQSMAVDLVTMDAELRRQGRLVAVGGAEYLVELVQFVPTTANVRYYIRIVQEKATLRRLIEAARGIESESFSQEDDLPDILNHAEKRIFDIAMRRTGEESLKPIKEVLLNTFTQIEEYARLKGGVSGVPTGFYDLDNLLTGLHGGELILVGARPSMGKTSFAINIATHAALKKKKVAVFSLEMPREQIALRMLCGDARVNMQAVRQGTLRDEDWMKLAKSLGPLSASDVYIDDTAGLSPTQVRSRCRRLMMDHGLDLIIIDYLQLMAADGRVENRQLEVSEISRGLKAIALELKVPLIACAQLSRANTQRAVKKPMLSDLRDSGSIEQDADVCMFLHRESYYDDTVQEKNVAEVIVAKQRNGPLGTIKVAWLGEYTLFDNLAGGGLVQG